MSPPPRPWDAARSAARRLARMVRPRPERRVHAWLLAFGLLTAVSALLLANRAQLHQRQTPVALTLLLVALLGNVLGGRALALALAVGGFLVINYYFQAPYRALSVHSPADWVALGSFVVTAEVASRLLARAQRQAAAAQRRAEDVARLADLGAETLATPLSTEALRRIASVVRETLRLDRCELWDVREGSAPSCVASTPEPPDPVLPGTAATAEESLAGLSALVRLSAADAGDPGETSATAEARRYASLFTGAPRDVVVPLRAHGLGVGALRLVSARGLRLDESERTFLQAIAHYAALAVERARLAAEVRQALLDREANRARDFLFATVSHDLRTPLTTIKALAHASALAGDRNAPMIEEQADRLTRMVADLLDLSRVRAGALPVTPELNTAVDVVGATLRQLAGVLGGRRVEPRLDETGGPLVGQFDFVATLRVLGNLLENAAKYAPAEAPIELEVIREGGELVFAVHDRGPGVAVAERARIFDAFHRTPGTAPDVGGAGLGLAVARALAEAQGGTLGYEARAGGGSSFTLRVPASDDAVALALVGEGVDEEGS